MVRVVYEWQVAEGDFAPFVREWRRATRAIRTTVAGARGSFLLRDPDDPTSVLTIARWDSLEAWQVFWRSADPEEMRTMRRLGSRRSVKAYHELEEWTS